MIHQKRQVTCKGEPFHFFQASGSDYEIGVAKGREMAGDIAFMWDYFRPNMEVWVGKSADSHRRAYEWLRNNLETRAPWMVEQMAGMADGSGVAIDRLFLINHYGLLWTCKLLCTSIALADTDAGPLLGQNLDIGDDDNYFVEELRPAGVYAVLSDGFAGMCWAPTGINEKGLAVGSSMLATPSQDGQPVVEGYPYHFLPRLVLRECATVSEAVEYLKELTPVIPPAGGYQLNMVDRTGEMAVVDKTGDHTVVHRDQGGMNLTTNYSLDPELESWRVGTGQTDSNYPARANHIRSLFLSANGAPTVEWMKSALRSHDGDGRLCRHGADEGGGYSRLSFVYYPRTGGAEISNGWPCCNEYQEFRIELEF